MPTIAIPQTGTASTRTEVIRPTMCGHNSLFVGQIGDWTWDAVSEQCGIDVLRARNRAGDPTYLSFYYFRIRGGPAFHLHTPAFGDQLAVTSRVFGFGSESVLTLHRIAPVPDGVAAVPSASGWFEPSDFYAAPDPGCLYVENFNRWVTRGQARTNTDLVRSSPRGFRYEHLPVLPAAYSPRKICREARIGLSFLSEPGWQPGAVLTASYQVDLTRDLNGAGLLYFASYFSIIDWGLWRMWQQLGRGGHAFLARVVTDQQVCYLGNADAGAGIEVTLQHWQRAGGGSAEAFDVVLREESSRRLLAVCTLRLSQERNHD